MSEKKFTSILLTAIFFTLISLVAQAQHKHSYVVIEGRQIKKEGMVKQYENEPFQSIKITNSEGSYNLYPDQVEGYSDLAGNYYESREIDFNGTPTKYFLKHVSESDFGRLLFCIDDAFAKRFFLDDGSLIEMNGSEKGRGSYISVLRKLGDCKNKREIMEYANYSENGLSRTLESLSTCEIPFTPKKKFLFSADVGIVNLNPRRGKDDFFLVPILFLKNDLDNKKTTQLRLHAGLSLPYKNSNLSFVQFLGFNRLKHSFNNSDGFSAYDMEYESSSLEYSFLLKLATAQDKYQFSVMAGPALSYTLSSMILLTETGFDPNIGDFVTTTQPLDEINLQLGYETRLQLESKMTDRVGVGVYFSFGQLFPVMGDVNRFTVLRLSGGISGSYIFGKLAKRKRSSSGRSTQGRSSRARR